MATKRPVSNLLGLAVLTYLTQGPMHAYEIQRLLRERDADRTFRFSYGALYGVVRRLLEAGWIAQVGTGRRGKLPQQTIYELTDAGDEAMRDWLRELIAEPEHEYTAFGASLSLVVVLPPDEVVELLQTRLARVEEQRAAIAGQVEQGVRDGLHPVFLVEDDYRAALLDAETGFIRDLIGRVPAWREQWEAARAGTDGAQS
ncbi:PadR family transcriptional regulator [Ornithinimicrobium cavernae]|uniref:PadR family transcriptional regulator n=1 Tax=Ornithinimicrobium cavernae TaxID=2666047 RepID=UPI000D68AAF0|nr:PadR family transcriptional regulator [Ornithinimicrobium cavernae]